MSTGLRGTESDSTVTDAARNLASKCAQAAPDSRSPAPASPALAASRSEDGIHAGLTNPDTMFPPNDEQGRVGLVVREHTDSGRAVCSVAGEPTTRSRPIPGSRNSCLQGSIGQADIEDGAASVTHASRLSRRAIHAPAACAVRSSQAGPPTITGSSVTARTASTTSTRRPSGSAAAIETTTAIGRAADPMAAAKASVGTSPPRSTTSYAADRNRSAAIAAGRLCRSPGAAPTTTVPRRGPRGQKRGPSRPTNRSATAVARCSSLTSTRPLSHRRPIDASAGTSICKWISRARRLPRARRRRSAMRPVRRRRAAVPRACGVSSKRPWLAISDGFGAGACRGDVALAYSVLGAGALGRKSTGADVAIHGHVVHAENGGGFVQGEVVARHCCSLTGATIATTLLSYRRRSGSKVPPHVIKTRARRPVLRPHFDRQAFLAIAVDLLDAVHLRCAILRRDLDARPGLDLVELSERAVDTVECDMTREDDRALFTGRGSEPVPADIGRPGDLHGAVGRDAHSSNRGVDCEIVDVQRARNVRAGAMLARVVRRGIELEQTAGQGRAVRCRSRWSGTRHDRALRPLVRRTTSGGAHPRARQRARASGACASVSAPEPAGGGGHRSPG